MANNYLQFSTQINNLTQAEAEWWKAKLAELEALQEGDEERDDGKTASELMDEEELGFVASCFDVELLDVWVHADESGNPDHVAAIIQEFLKANRPDDCFSFEWACTCSKLRLDEFSGGGVFITAEEIKWFDAGTLILQAVADHENKAKSNE